MDELQDELDKMAADAAVESAGLDDVVVPTAPIAQKTKVAD